MKEQEFLGAMSDEDILKLIPCFLNEIERRGNMNQNFGEKAVAISLEQMVKMLNASPLSDLLKNIETQVP